MKSRKSPNIKTVLEILKDEVNGDITSALEKLAKDYSMTWVYKSESGLFPLSQRNFKKDVKEAYAIRGRQYDIKNIGEGKNVVFVEMIESYPDPKIKKVYRTPLVLVLEMKNGKIQTGRHYCDPRIAFEHLSQQQAEKVFGNKKQASKLIIK